MTESEAIKVIEKNRPTSGYAMLNEALDIAIKALKKHIPMKPNKAIDSTWGIKKEVHVCPVCDYYLSEVHFIGESNKKITYCETCGQSIDWND